MIVLDASALLAFLLVEPGEDVVRAALTDEPAACGAANWSEVLQKLFEQSENEHDARQLVGSYDMAIEPVTERDASWAARRWTRGEGLSLGDRLCLALADRLDADVLTADRSWGDAGRIRQIR